ncbi:MATE family efflux transporter [Clostridium sediminicola]|uniref:MATE family efflux transporter n=1 Tax=Clostridium sediminicola TaxID=3114879 RepID=UPI0031F21058
MKKYEKDNDLTEGKILESLIKLALPIMGTSFIQMAYSIVDMIWVGRLGSKSVAAIGTAGFFTWLAMAFILIPKTGAEIRVAQSIGRKNIKEANNFAVNTIQLTIVLAILYGTCLLIFKRQLICFFNIKDTKVINEAISYLVIISMGMFFYFINPVFTGIINGYGNSKTPFIINTIGLVTNMIFDPLMIFGIGPFPLWGIKGAAIATILSQLIVTIIFIYFIKARIQLFSGFSLFKIPDRDNINTIIKLGLPVAFQSGLFTIFSMFIARIVASWGPEPIAVQKIGSQIESISWMTASGFATALSTFVGQNYGAKKWGRIYKGYILSMGVVAILGIIATCLLIFGAKPIFSIFINEEETVRQGVVYLRILGIAQFFIWIEITTSGAFNGLGRTIPPSLVGIIFNGLRIPASMILSDERLLGLKGVWWSISISGLLKGVILTTWFIVFIWKHPEINAKNGIEHFFKSK